MTHVPSVANACSSPQNGFVFARKGTELSVTSRVSKVEDKNLQEGQRKEGAGRAVAADLSSAYAPLTRAGCSPD
jgi:hypothetical protein